jgi:hypothetical protein
MRTFQEFLEEGLKSKLKSAYVQGRKENEPVVKVSHLPPASGTHQPMSKIEVMKSLNAQGGIGGGAIKRAQEKKEKEINKAAKKSAKRIIKMSEDLEARRQQLAQRQRDNAAAFKERSLAAATAQKEKIADYQSAQKERVAKQTEREQLKKEIKQELQTEQHPTMEPTEYNTQVSRQQATWKGRQIRQSHGEMQSKAQAELSAKKARMKAIMSR